MNTLPSSQKRIPAARLFPRACLGLLLATLAPAALRAEPAPKTELIEKATKPAKPEQTPAVASDEDAARQKEEAAERSLRQAERAARSGAESAKADLLEARVAARLARMEHRDAKAAMDTAAAPATEATRELLWNDITTARTPQARREATARYTEYQRLVLEEKHAADRPQEDKK